jgi:hypothetical protein
MYRALTKATPAKAEIRLSHAIRDFEAILSDQQRAVLQTYKSDALAAAPTSEDVIKLTTEIDVQASAKTSRCFGPRFFNFIQAVQRYAALGDVVVGKSFHS